MSEQPKPSTERSADEVDQQVMPKEQVAALRALPIKEIVPPIWFRPTEP